MAAFLTQFDVTAVVVVMPQIAGELRLGVAGYAWVMDAYSLAFAGALLAAGAVADRFGRRRALVLGNAFFALASIGCGLAWDGPSLLAARAAQGLGAAFVVTGAIALIAHSYPEAGVRARAFALLGVLSGVAMAFGPTVGGVIAGWFGWRWIFFLNLPVCLLVIWGVPRLIAEARDPAPRPIDLPGVALLTLALGIAIEALLRGGRDAGVLATGLGLSAALFAAFALQQPQRAQPALDPAVFATPVMRAVTVLLFTVSVGYWAVLVYLPLYLAAALGWSAEAAGLGLLAATVPFLVIPPLAGRLAGRWGWRRFFAAGLALLVAGDGLLVAATAVGEGGARLALILLGMAAAGGGAAWVHPQLSGAVVALVPDELAGMASAVTVVLRQAGFALGIAALGAALPGAQAAEGFAWPFAVAAGGALCGLVAAVLLPPRCGGN